MTPKDSTSFAAALPEVKLPPLAPEEVVKRSRGTSVTHDAEPAISSEAVENPRTTQELLQSTAIPRNSSWVPEWVGQTKPPVIGEAEPIAKAEPTAPAATSGELIEVPSPEEQAKMIESLEPQGTRELLAQLKAADKFEAAAIREALVARGIAVEELALADKLFAADAAERLALVDDLKVLPARTARRWLRELLVDQEAEVRLRALSALATTNDPELPSIARDMAVRDSDRRVAELALRVIREMR
jgi:hypothetical protein